MLLPKRESRGSDEASGRGPHAEFGRCGDVSGLADADGGDVQRRRTYNEAGDTCNSRKTKLLAVGVRRAQSNASSTTAATTG